MYVPKGTTIPYRVVKVKCGDIEKEMVLIDKDIFESVVTMLGFEKKEDDVDKTEQEEKQE
jgi:hypothetical protein